MAPPPPTPSKPDSCRDTVIPELPAQQSVCRMRALEGGVGAHLLTTQKHTGNVNAAWQGSLHQLSVVQGLKGNLSLETPATSRNCVLE